MQSSPSLLENKHFRLQERGLPLVEGDENVTKFHILHSVQSSPIPATIFSRDEKFKTSPASFSCDGCIDVLGLWFLVPQDAAASLVPAVVAAVIRDRLDVARYSSVSCIVPGIDYPRYMYSGPQIPKQGDFDSIRKLCSHADVMVE